MFQTTTRAPGDALDLRGVTRVFADGSGLQPLDLLVRAGEFVSVLGPSGCGKSTLLRCVAGLETPDGGTIRFGEHTVLDHSTGTVVPPRERGLGMVFQDLALWPHLNTTENVAFPLRVARVPKTEIDARVSDALHLVGLADYATKMPHQLSGGQQQRVAIARAIVAKPTVLLMDEPFSALDASLRHQLRDELQELTGSLGLTTLYVTHDQAEAMAMSDRIAVLERGELRQIATPEALYQRPANRFVAEFIGQCNWLPHQEGRIGIRPEHVRIATSGEGQRFEATVTRCSYTGGTYAITCTVPGASQPWNLTHPSRLDRGEHVSLFVDHANLITVTDHTTTEKKEL